MYGKESSSMTGCEKRFWCRSQYLRARLCYCESQTQTRLLREDTDHAPPEKLASVIIRTGQTGGQGPEGSR